MSLSNEVRERLETLRGEVLSVFGDASATLGAELSEPARTRLQPSHRRVSDGRSTVVCCGEFRRGKSSLLNALIERELFPVDVSVTTAVVISLEWAADEYAIVHFGNQERPASRRNALRISLDEVKLYASEQENPRNLKDVSQVEEFAPISQLEGGLVLVDTPGIGSVNPAHTAKTYAFLPQADAILFVSGATEPLTTHETSFLTYALNLCPIVITALTKADLVQDARVIVKSARERIAEVLLAQGRDEQVSEEDLVIIPVSAYRKWAALKDDDPELLAASGFPLLETELWTGLVATCGTVPMVTALTELEEELNTAQAPLDNEHAVLQGNERLNTMEQELKDILKESRELKKSGAKWRREFRVKLTKAGGTISEQLDSDLQAARDRLHDDLTSSSAWENPNTLLSAAALEVVEAINRASLALERDSIQLARECEKHTKLKINLSGNEAPTFKPTFAIPKLEQEAKGGMMRRVRETYVSGIAGGGFGTIVGAIVGTVILPGVGTAAGAGIGSFLGQIGGMIAGARDSAGREGRDGARRNAQLVRNSLTSQMDKNNQRALRSFERTRSEVATALEAALEGGLDAQQESLEASLDALSKLKDAEQKARDERLPWLVKRLTDYAQLREKLTNLRQSIVEFRNSVADDLRSQRDLHASAPDAAA